MHIVTNTDIISILYIAKLCFSHIVIRLNFRKFRSY